MGTYQYTVPVVYSAQDNYSHTAKRTYKIRDCAETLVSTNEADLWCNQKCSQDENYYQPFVVGDKIYFQFTNNNTAYWKVLPKIINSITGAVIPSESLITTQTGTDADDNNYFNLVIDTTTITAECWYLKIYLFECEVNDALYSDCVAASISGGATEEEAELECSIELCGEGVTEFISEPFKLEECNNTLLIEGVYPKFDCNGKYYDVLTVGDTPDVANIFRLKFRIPAELFEQNYSFESTLINNEKQSSTQRKVYQMLTQKLPPYVVEQVAAAFNAKEFYIDGEQYVPGAELQRNTETGLMWILNPQVSKICDNINFGCE